MKLEHRTVGGEVRAIDGNEPTNGTLGKIEGYAALFDTRSELLGGYFFEVIAPGAFDDALAKDDSDVRALFNHNDETVFARESVGNLVLTVDERGLKYEAEIPDDISDAADLMARIKRGLIKESSFGFTVAPGGASWELDEEGREIRTVTKISRVYDVSPVAFPAYADTDVAVRSLKKWKQTRSIDVTGTPAPESTPAEETLDTLLEELRSCTDPERIAAITKRMNEIAQPTTTSDAELRALLESVNQANDEKFERIFRKLEMQTLKIEAAARNA